MNLGKTLWGIKLSEDEKSRIAKELARNDSLCLQVFRDHHRHNKLFTEICKKLLREITGFRPTSEVYRGKVTEEVLSSLRKNRARKDYWHLYLCSVASYVNEQLPALNQLLEDTKVEEGFETNSESILSRISELASEFSVHDKDLENLYELWPFTRSERIRDYLSNCSKFDRFRALEESVRAVEKKFEKSVRDQVHDLSEQLNHLSLEFAKTGVRRSDVENSIANLAVKIEASAVSSKQSISELESNIARVEKFVRRVRRHPLFSSTWV